MRKLLGYTALSLVLGALAFYVAQALMTVLLLVGSLLVALLLTALLEPLARRLCRIGLPEGLSAGIVTFALLGTLIGASFFIYRRAANQVQNLNTQLRRAIDEVRAWLVTGPLNLDAAQLREVRDAVVAYLEQAAPSPVAGATTVLRLLSAALIVLFTVFFLLKDGPEIWRWLLSWTPKRHRERTDLAGRAGWQALTGYVRGTVVVAIIDAVGIGGALILLGVPLWFSLTLLTFLGAFVPLVGATVAGAVAVLVTLVTEGGRDAVIIFVVVLVVQQIEGNLLQPLIVGRAVSLHPLAVIVAVTAGALVLGILGAVIAVPLTAVSYRIATRLRETRCAPHDAAGGPGQGGGQESPPAPAGSVKLSSDTSTGAAASRP